MTHPALLLAAFFLATAASASAGSSDTVRAAKFFAIGGIGVAGTICPEEYAYRELRDGPEAQTKFRKLLRDASPAGQMYALFGLRQLDAADYPALSEPFRKSATPVEVISGCNIHTDPTSEVVQWIDQWARKIREWEKP